MQLNDERKACLAERLRYRYSLENVQDEFVFFDGGETDVVDVFNMTGEEKKIVRSDIGYLFPYAKEGPSFDVIGKLGRNIFLIDDFSFADPLKPKSPLRIDNYEQRLVALMEKEKVDPSCLSDYSSAFHAIVEKVTFKDFLNGERGIKEKDYRCYYLIVNTKEESSSFSTASYIFKAAMKDTAEKLCLIDKGNSKEFTGVDLCRK